MAKRQFEIQGSTLRIGGVDLQAGTTGVVIPGVTQATSYRVEEVEETGDQTQTFSGTVTVIDKVTYDSYVASGSSTGKATFNVDLKDNGKIDEIEVDNEGTYTSAQASANNDMYAYTGSSGTPFSPFVSSDWATIPFRPKMRAGNIETIGGGGGGATSLDELNNVNISDLADGDMLRWDDNEEEWVNSSIPTASTSQLGAVKVDGTTITIANDGTISAAGGGGGTPGYKGLKAIYGKMFDNNDDPNGPINKIVIYQESASPSSTIDPSTNDDTFEVTGLTGSSVVALLVAISDNINETSNTDLVAFAESIIDNVMLDGGVQGDFNTIDGMKDAFYNNFNSFKNLIPSIKTDFEFFNFNNRRFYLNWNNKIYTGAGSGFNISSVFSNPYTQVITMDSGGNGVPGGFIVGETITILGTDITDYNGSNLASPTNDLTITVDTVDGSGIIQTYTITGTLPDYGLSWPSDYIGDGGDDEYDDGNYISTDVANNISYNGGNSVIGSSEFNGGDYVTVFKDGIFGMFAVGANINSIKTDGGSGFDGSGQATTGDLIGTAGGGGVSLGNFVFSNDVMTINSSGSEDMTVRAIDDLYLEARGDDIHLRAEDDIRLHTGYNFTDDSYQTLYRFNSGNGGFSISDSNGTYGTIQPSLEGSDRVLIMGGESEAWVRSDFGNYTWKFDKNGVTQIPGLIQGNGNVNISIDSNFTSANQLFRFRGGDIASHLHFDTSNSVLYDLYVGDDSQYVKVSKDGTIDVGTQTVVGGANTWQFDRAGDFSVPGDIKTKYTDQVGLIFTNIPTWDSDGSGIYTWFNVTENDRPEVHAVGQAASVGWTVQVNGGNSATITSINPAGFFSFTTNVPLTGTGTLNFTSDNYQAPQPTDLVLRAGVSSLKLRTNGDVDANDSVRTFKSVSQTVGASVAGTIWNTTLDIQTVKFLVYGLEATTGHSQSCEVLVTKASDGTLATTVYALVHTSATPLYTLDAGWQTGTTRLDATVPGANSVTFHVHATALFYD